MINLKKELEKVSTPILKRPTPIPYFHLFIIGWISSRPREANKTHFGLKREEPICQPIVEINTNFPQKKTSVTKTKIQIYYKDFKCNNLHLKSMYKHHFLL